MTDHNSPAGGTGGNQPPVQPGQFGPPNMAAGQQQPQPPQQQGQQPHPPQQGQQVPHQAPQPYGYPAPAQQAQQAQQAQPQPPMASDAARAQVAAAWTRRAPQAAVPPGEAAVPALPPRQHQAPGAAGPSKKDRREQARLERKAAYEAKKAERESRKRGGAPALAPTPVGAAGTSATSAPAGAPARTATGASFDIPRPGGRLPATGRGTHVALRATLLFTTCAFALGSCGVVGLAIGKSSSAPTAALDKKDVQKYRLTEFPTRAAATFAEKYATLCLTYDAKAADQRRDELARYATSGVDRDCGWNGQGTQSVTSAVWDGSVEDLPEYGKNGRYLGVQVTLSTGRVTTVSVPVYVANPASGAGLRVVGDVGEMPLPGRGTAPEVDRDAEVVDDTLSDQLKAQVLPGYFTAWGASDTTAMSRFTTPDATAAATSGLAGVLSAPKVETVEALAPAGTDDDDTVTYKYGQSVPVRVTVVWGGAGSEGGTGTTEATTEVTRSYRVTVVNTAQGWFIKDVRGAVLDPVGGRGDGTDPSATPSPGTSTPPAGTGTATPPPATGAAKPPATNPATKPAKPKP